MTIRLAIDLDGVLADTMITFCRILNQRRSTNLTVESFASWNAWEIAHITKHEFFRTLDDAWFDWETIPPTEDNIGNKVGLLRKFGRLDIVTGRSQETVSQAKSWLKQYKVPYDAFIRTNSTRSKADLNYDFFIDDSAELMSVLASSLDRCGIMYTQPWNKNAPDMPRIFKVERWDEIPALLLQLATKP